MEKIKTYEDLCKSRDHLKRKIDGYHVAGAETAKVQIKVAMATCGIASGAKKVMNFFQEEITKQKLNAVVTQTGCMGYCYAEPTIEVTLPGKEPVVFGNVNTKKAQEIIDKYITNTELVEGVIETAYQSIEN